MCCRYPSVGEAVLRSTAPVTSGTLLALVVLPRAFGVALGVCQWRRSFDSFNSPRGDWSTEGRNLEARLNQLLKATSAHDSVSQAVEIIRVHDLSHVGLRFTTFLGVSGGKISFGSLKLETDRCFLYFSYVVEIVPLASPEGVPGNNWDRRQLNCNPWALSSDGRGE